MNRNMNLSFTMDMNRSDKEMKQIIKRYSNFNWATPTWCLLHTIASKVVPQYFSRHRQNLINLVKKICHTLPCPYCKEHASHFVDNYNYNKIKNNEDFKLWLWEFHNTVNVQTGKQPRTVDIINNYAMNDLNKLLIFWNTKFTINVFSGPGIKIATEMNNTVRMVNDYISNNKYLFNL